MFNKQKKYYKMSKEIENKITQILYFILKDLQKKDDKNINFLKKNNFDEIIINYFNNLCDLYLGKTTNYNILILKNDKNKIIFDDIFLKNKQNLNYDILKDLLFLCKKCYKYKNINNFKNDDIYIDLSKICEFMSLHKDVSMNFIELIITLTQPNITMLEKVQKLI